VRIARPLPETAALVVGGADPAEAGTDEVERGGNARQRGDAVEPVATIAPVPAMANAMSM
jgi:hypothetical protein